VATSLIYFRNLPSPFFSVFGGGNPFSFLYLDNRCSNVMFSFAVRSLTSLNSRSFNSDCRSCCRWFRQARSPNFFFVAPTAAFPPLYVPYAAALMAAAATITMVLYNEASCGDSMAVPVSSFVYYYTSIVLYVLYSYIQYRICAARFCRYFLFVSLLVRHEMMPSPPPGPASRTTDNSSYGAFCAH
jgi:hypothetical protein